MTRVQTFKDYWETKSLITLKEYNKKYKKVSFLEQKILQNPYGEWDWYSISSNTEDVSLDFIHEFSKLLDWDKVSERNDLTEDFIRLYHYKINFDLISYDNLSIYFIREYRDILDWDKLSKRNNLSEEFYTEFQNYIDWKIISQKHLSEEFIRKFQNKVDWDYISKRTDLSNKFLLEFIHKLNLTFLDKKLLTIIMYYQYYANKIKSWYIRMTRKHRRSILINKIKQTSQKNLFIKSIHQSLKNDKNCYSKNKKEKEIIACMLLAVLITYIVTNTM